MTFHDTGNQGTKSRIITFVSASGGAGATTLALSAAEYLASKSAERAASTCLVDLRFPERQLRRLPQPVQPVRPRGHHRPAGTARCRTDGCHQAVAPVRSHHVCLREAATAFRAARQRFRLPAAGPRRLPFDDIVIDLPNIETPWQNSRAFDERRDLHRLRTNVASLRQGKRLYRRSANCAAMRSASRSSPTSTSANGSEPFRAANSRRSSRRRTSRSSRAGQWLLTDALNRAILPPKWMAGRFNKDLKKMFKESGSMTLPARYRIVRGLAAPACWARHGAVRRRTSPRRDRAFRIGRRCRRWAPACARRLPSQPPSSQERSSSARTRKRFTW